MVVIEDLRVLCVWPAALWVLLPAALHGEQLCVRFSWSSL
jgi:hypothetical protein